MTFVGAQLFGDVVRQIFNIIGRLDIKASGLAQLVPKPGCVALKTLAPPLADTEHRVDMQIAGFMFNDADMRQPRAIAAPFAGDRAAQPLLEFGKIGFRFVGGNLVVEGERHEMRGGEAHHHP